MSQPSVEELFIREAVKHLTPKQRVIWEYWNLDRLTQDEIALKVGRARTTIQSTIKQCEKSIAKWCAKHQFVYELLKTEYKESEIEDAPNGEQARYNWAHKTMTQNGEDETDEEI
jgi:predicted DNA-binding protein YlxM (UPF0122 family)